VLCESERSLNHSILQLDTVATSNVLGVRPGGVGDPMGCVPRPACDNLDLALSREALELFARLLGGSDR